MRMRPNNRRPNNRRGSYRRQRPGTTPRTDSFMIKQNLDINCNVGQGFGIFQNDFEEKFLPYVTSVNIACGIHCGDPQTISRTIDIVKNYNVNIGALIGYNDKVSNGEREMYYDVDEIRSLVLYQLGALHALLHARGLQITHVRAQGFLYKQIYTDLLIAETVAKAVKEFSTWLILVGLSGPILANACSNANVRAGHEVQIAKRYRKDGTIIPYSPSVSIKTVIDESSSRAREVINSGRINCEDRNRVSVNMDTIHIPSDKENYVELARTIRALIPKPKPIHMEKHEKYLAAYSVLS